MQFSSTKGQHGGAIAAIIIIIVIVGALVFLSPGIFSGLGGFGGNYAGIVGPGSQGVVITSFTKDAQIVEKNVPVIFTLQIENKGEVEARGVRATIFGLPSRDWTLSRETFDIPTTLDPADISNNIPGQVETADVEAEPIAKKATDTTYTVGVRVRYDYKSEFEGLLRVASKDYIRSISTPGTSQQGVSIVSSKTTAGPFTITARTRTTTIDSGVGTIRVTFDITNTGGGRAFEKGATIPTISNLDRITISGGDNTQCETSGTTRLISARTKTITCSVNADVPAEGFENIPFGIKIEYAYFIDSTTTVTLLKGQEF